MRVAPCGGMRRYLIHACLVLAAAAIVALSHGAAAGQQPPKIHGITGTIALPANVDKIYDGVNTLIVTTADGARHVIHPTPDAKVHGADTLADLPRGTPVVVHYTMNGGEKVSDEIDALGPEGLKSTEGVVSAVDRVHKTLTVQYASGSKETLKLTHHASTEGGTLKGNRVVVYYTNDQGQKVAHYFKRKSQ